MTQRAQRMGLRSTPHALITELALRASDRSIALRGPVTDGNGGLGFLLVLAGVGEPIRAWIEVGESSITQLGELGDVLARTFTSVEAFPTNVALAEAVLKRWPLSSRALQMLRDERALAGV